MLLSFNLQQKHPLWHSDRAITWGDGWFRSTDHGNNHALSLGTAAWESVSIHYIPSVFINRCTWNENWLPVILSLCWELSEKSKVTSSKHEAVCVHVFVVLFRLYPVGITVQRMPIKDIVLQNYHVPAGVSDQTVTHKNIQAHSVLQLTYPVFNGMQLSPQTMVHVCLYPLGRSAEVFEDPQRFDPGRWSSSREEGQRAEGLGFRSLAFGFGARQCVGRRIAENEMQLLLMHVSDSWWEKGERVRKQEGGWGWDDQRERLWCKEKKRVRKAREEDLTRLTSVYWAMVEEVLRFFTS